MRNRKEIKDQGSQEGPSSVFNILLDPTPAEAKELKQKRAKEESPGYELPKHHKSPPSVTRSSPRPKRATRTEPVIAELFSEVNNEFLLECNKDFWAPVVSGDQATTVNQVEPISSPPGLPRLQAFPSVNPVPAVASQTTATMTLPSDESAMPWTKRI